MGLPAAAAINKISAAAGRRGLGAGPCPPSAAASEIGISPTILVKIEKGGIPTGSCNVEVADIDAAKR